MGYKDTNGHLPSENFCADSALRENNKQLSCIWNKLKNGHLSLFFWECATQVMTDWKLCGLRYIALYCANTRTQLVLFLKQKHDVYLLWKWQLLCISIRLVTSISPKHAYVGKLKSLSSARISYNILRFKNFRSKDI